MDLDAVNGMMERQVQIISLLTKIPGARVDVVSLISNEKKLNKWIKCRNLNCKSFDRLSIKFARFVNRIWYIANTLLCNKLRYLDNFYLPTLGLLPRRLADDYDLIWCYYPWLFKLLGLHRFGSKVFVDLADVMSSRHKLINVRRWISLHENDEKFVINSDAKCICISSEDFAFFSSAYKKSLIIVPFCPVNTRELILSREVSTNYNIGFIGAPSSSNEEVVDLVTKSIFISFLNAENYRLIIGGGISNYAHQKLQHNKTDSITVIGSIDSLSSFYKSIKVVFNPVGPSTGVKIKSVEALISGKMLVTTKWGITRELEQYFSNQLIIIDWPLDMENIKQKLRIACEATHSIMEAVAENYISFADSMLTSVVESNT